MRDARMPWTVGGLTKFVGRENELAQMKSALGVARSGHGQIVAVVAEAGHWQIAIGVRIQGDDTG
jgi:hypothetical protein